MVTISSMHACLNVDEILRHLARELVASGGKGAAVALACCCKNFEDPVLDALWETQDQLRPLLKSFPVDVWNDEDSSFKRIPTRAEWARFQTYARRIQALHVDPSQDPLPPDVLSVLQHRTLNTPLLPGLKTFVCREATVVFIPFIPLFLSPGIAVIDIKFAGSIPALMIASMIATFSTLCPNLLEITLRRLPLDEVITTAVSNMLLACNLDALRKFEVDSLLTTAAYEVLYRLPNLRELFTIFLGDTLLPPVLLPNLVGMEMTYLFGHEWLRRLNGATLNKLTSVFFHTASLDVGDFLEAFESFALATSISTKLSTFVFYSYYPWNPNYSSLLGFKQLTELIIITPCHVGCSSAVGDDIVINLARAMPKLKVLLLGSDPCPIPTGVTVKGLVELACHCIDLCTLRVHIRVDSLVQAAAGDVVTSPSTAEPASIPRAECALTNLGVGNMPIQEGSALTVALALLHIFPRISQIKYTNPHWRDVQNTITLSKRLSNRIGALARFSRDTLSSNHSP